MSDDAAAAEQICCLLLATAARAADAVARALAIDGQIDVAELEVLYRLTSTRDKRASMGELCNLVVTDKNRVTRLVDRLVERGLVRRTASPADGRVILASPTAEGDAALHRAAPRWAAGIREMLGPLPPPRLNLLGSLLDRLNNGVDGTSDDDRATIEVAYARRTAPLLDQLLTSDGAAGAARVDHQHGAAWIALLRAAAALDRELQTRLVSAHGLTRAEFLMLRMLAGTSERAASMATVAAATGMSRGGVSRMTNRLEQRSMVRRTPHPTNRRIVLCHLLNAGLAAQEGAEVTWIDTLQARVSEILGPEQSLDLIELLDGIAAVESRHS